MIEPNFEGRIRCPECSTLYLPKLKRPLGDYRPIQQIFPDATPIEREQLISGIGCETCWKAFIGLPARDIDCTCGK